NAGAARFLSYSSTLTLNRAAGGAGGAAGGATGAAGNGIGGGVHVSNAVGHRLFSTIDAGNSAPTSPDFNGTLLQASNNLIGDGTGASGAVNGNGNLVGTAANPINPLLNLLADNGGATLTHALGQNSP